MHLLYRSKWLLLSAATISFLIVLMASAVIKMSAAQGPLPGYDHPYAEGYISVDESLSSNYEVCIRAEDALMDSKQSFILLSIESDRIFKGCAITCSGMKIPLKMVYGSFLSEKDYMLNRNCVAVSAETLDGCIKRNGDYYFNYHNNEIPVIGAYESTDRYGNYLPDYFIPYNAQQFADTGHANFAIYTADDAPIDLAKIMKKSLENEFEGTYVDLVEGEKKSYLPTERIGRDSIVEVLMIALLVIINSMAVCNNWLGGHVEELKVRYLCGSSNIKCILYIIAKYMALTMAASVLGLIAVEMGFLILRHVAIADSARVLFGTGVSYTSLAAGLGSTLIIGLVTIVVSIWKTSKGANSR